MSVLDSLPVTARIDEYIPNVTFEVPRLGVHEVLLENPRYDPNKTVCVSRYADGLLAEPGRSHFGRKCPAELAGRELEHKGPD